MHTLAGAKWRKQLDGLDGHLHGFLPHLLHVRLCRRPGEKQPSAHPSRYFDLAGDCWIGAIYGYIMYIFEPDSPWHHSTQTGISPLYTWSIASPHIFRLGPVVQLDVYHIAIPWLSLCMHSTMEATPNLHVQWILPQAQEGKQDWRLNRCDTVQCMIYPHVSTIKKTYSIHTLVHQGARSLWQTMPNSFKAQPVLRNERSASCTQGADSSCLPSIGNLPMSSVSIQQAESNITKLCLDLCIWISLRVYHGCFQWWMQNWEASSISSPSNINHQTLPSFRPMPFRFTSSSWLRAWRGMRWSMIMHVPKNWRLKHSEIRNSACCTFRCISTVTSTSLAGWSAARRPFSRMTVPGQRPCSILPCVTFALKATSLLQPEGHHIPAKRN